LKVFSHAKIYVVLLAQYLKEAEAKSSIFEIKVVFYASSTFSYIGKLLYGD
jgi:hypothetical protein